MNRQAQLLPADYSSAASTHAQLHSPVPAPFESPGRPGSCLSDRW